MRASFVVIALPRVAAVFVALFLMAPPTHGQGSGAAAALTGQIVDQTGAVISNARIELEEIKTGARRETVTNSLGYFTIDQIPRGVYQLTARMTGLADTVVSPIELQVNQVSNLTVTLKPGNVKQTVEVSATALRLETQTSNVGAVLTNTAVKQLPSRYRNPMELVGALPGVTAVFVTGQPQGAFDYWSRNNFEVAGAGRTTAVVQIDGIDARNDLAPGNSGVTVIPSNDTVEEFKVQATNYSAEYGRGSAVVSMVTKSGTNELHGSLFYYHQNDVLNANDFFNNARGLPRPKEKRHQFGGTFGGPVYLPGIYDGRNKTWFFTGWEQFRRITPANVQLRIPTAAEKAGDFSNLFATNGSPITIYNPFDTFVDTDGRTKRRPFPNNRIPSSMLDTFAANVNKFWPEPNRPGGQLGSGGVPTQIGNFVKSVSNQYQYTRFDIKVDHQIGIKHRLMVRYSANPEFAPAANIFDNVASPVIGGGGAAGTQDVLWQNLVASHNWILSPTMLISQTAMFGRRALNSRHHSFGYDPTPLGGPFQDGTIVNYAKVNAGGTVFPALRPAGYPSLGTPGGGNQWVDTPLGYQLRMSKTSGRHDLRWGYEYRQSNGEHGARSSPFGMTGEYDFTGAFTNGPDPLLPSAFTGNGFADFQLGLVRSGDIFNLTTMMAVTKYNGWYIQDNVRVTPKLTLNLGLRYDFTLPIKPRFDNVAIFDPNIDNPLGAQTGPNTGGKTLNEFLGQPLKGGYVFVNKDTRRLIPTDYSNLSPRLGLAYQPTSKTVIRGGFAKMYSLPYANAPGYSADETRTLIVSTIDGINPVTTMNSPFPDGIRPPPPPGQGNALTNVGFVAQGGISRKHPTPFLYQWNVGAQHELPSNMLLSVAYVGSRGRRLACSYVFCGDKLSQETIAQYGNSMLATVPNPFVGIITDPASILSRPTIQRGRLLKAWPQYASNLFVFPMPQGRDGFPLFTEEYPFRTAWDGVLVSVEKRFSGGLQLLLAYTGSKKMSNADDNHFGQIGPNVGFQNMHDMSQEYSRSASDVTHRLVISHVWDVPFGIGRRFGTNIHPAVDKILGGWQLSGMLTLASGFPLQIGVTPDLTSANFGSTIFGPGARPNLIAEPRTNGGSRGERIRQWVDPSAFKAPPPFTFGDAPRLLDIRGDGIKNYDFSIIKRIPLKERLNVEFRAEFFNFANRPQFAHPNMTFGSGSFGLVTATAGIPRVTQLALRLNW